jgi:hypothetical protein
MNDIIQVWNLFLIQAPKDGLGSRPTVLNFSSKEKMQQHIKEIVMKLGRLDRDFRDTLESLLAPEKFDLFMKIFRQVQLNNSQPLGFDLWYKEEPQVLL